MVLDDGGLLLIKFLCEAWRRCPAGARLRPGFAIPFLVGWVVRRCVPVFVFFRSGACLIAPFPFLRQGYCLSHGGTLTRLVFVGFGFPSLYLGFAHASCFIFVRKGIVLG